MDINSIIELKPNADVPELNPGDSVKVSAKVVEGDRERTQIFQGVIIRVRKGGVGANFTVRRVTHGIGVERTFPVHSSRLAGVEVVRKGKVRRAKLYYLRSLTGKAAKIKEQGRTTSKEG